MSNKILEGRLKGLVSEYKLLDEFTKAEAEKVKEYIPFIEKCKTEKTSYEEVKEDLQRFFEAQHNFKVLQDDIFGLASRLAEVSKLVNIVGFDLELSEEEVEIIEACKEFSKPVYIVENSKVKIQDTEYRDFLKKLNTEMMEKGNFLEVQYSELIGE